MAGVNIRAAWAVLFLLVAGMAQADNTDIKARALFKGSALLVIDGKQQLIKQGQTSDEGVMLVEATSKYAVIMFHGQQKTLKISRDISSNFAPADKAQVRLPSRSGGHYWASGAINGHTTDMMVDTGATTVALSETKAKALGIRYKKGVQGQVSTAGGLAKSWSVTLDSVAVGAVVVHQVPAVVIAGNYPEMVLLGNSFLDNVDLAREQGVLVITSRF